MSSVLYRKYRPKSFSELKGQETIKDILSYSIVNNTFSHGYLFSGPRGTGKTTTARLFARAINDSEFNKNNDLSVYLEDSIDIIEMDAASNRGIDEIRELRDNIQYLPAELKYKVYIIDEAHMLTKEAFNALLKTLEEPPAHVIFILATTEPHKVPITILSRVTRLDFRLAHKSELIEKLNKIALEESLNISEDALNQIYKLSGGSFRDAESILSKLIHSGQSEITVDIINKVFGLLPDEQIKEFLTMLQNNDFKGIVELVDEVEDSNIDYLVEGLLEYIVNTGSNKELIPTLIDIVKNIKFFKDKKIYMLAKLQEASNVSEVKNTNPSSKIVPEKIKKEIVESIDEKVEEKEPANSSNSINEALENTINDLESENKRLSAILKTCTVKRLEDSKLTLSNKYKFNISYLSQASNKKLILSNISKYYPLKEIQFENGHIETKVKALKVPENKDKNEEKELRAPEVKELKEKGNDKEKNDEGGYDNTELVESIL